MGAAGIAAKESPLANYYRWEEPYTDITVCLNLDAVNGLQAEVLNGAGSLPAAGIEVGGILLGRRELLEGRTVTVVEGFEPVPCEHCHGPFYSLTAADLVKLRSALARRRSVRSPEVSVIGYYRSHIRDDLFLSADDLSVIRTFFPDPENIFLVVKTLPGKACTAGFFFWENGKIQPEFTDSEVALIPIGRRSSTVPNPVLSDGAGAAEELLAISAVQSLHSGQGRRRALGGVGLLAVAAAAIFAVVSSHKTAQVPRLESSRPALAENLPGPPTTAPAEAPALDETAPKPAAAIPDAVEIPVPRNSDVPALPPAPQKAERLAVVSPPAAVNPNDRQQNQQKAAPDSVASLPSAMTASPSSTPLTSPAPAQVQPNAVSTNSVGTKEAPPAVVAAPKIVESAPPALDQQRPVAQAQVAPAQVTPAAPVLVPQTGSTYQSAETRFVGPQITHRVAPAIPLGVRTKISTDVRIDVTVTIDENGKVTGAHVTAQSGAAAGLLALEALKAAHLFRFQPAQENNQHVRSDMVLTFRFAPGAQ